MKEHVFIGWSRNRELAIEVKKILDDNGFVGIVGGVYEDNPECVRCRKGTVNETINYQMNHCDQAILLFRKIDDNMGISGNLIYELGYINAQYNIVGSYTKLHIYKIDITQADDNLFPSDLHGVWGTMVSSHNKTNEEIAKEITDEFFKNQNQVKKFDRFKLLNDHHFVEYEISRHFETPTMSDYDLATEILVYMQAAFCYQEQKDMRLKMERFKTRLYETENYSQELKFAVDYACLTLELFCQTVPSDDEFQTAMEGKRFRDFLHRYISIGERILEHINNYFEEVSLESAVVDENFCKVYEFEALFLAQVQQHITYLILVYLNNDAINDEERKKYASDGVLYCISAIKNLEIIASKKEEEMYAKMLLGFVYKNLSTFYTYIGDVENRTKFQKKSLKMRQELNSYVKGLTMIRPSFKDYITLEYLMQCVEVAKDCTDKYERSDYIEEIEAFLERRERFKMTRDLLVNMLSKEYKSIISENSCK